jgi:CheY-like chemotaxis protein
MTEIVRLNLEMVGDYDVEIASTGGEGLAKIEESQFDLVVTDFMLPGITGDEVLRRTRLLHPDLPIVLFSIYYDDATTISAQAHAMADACLRKPLDHDELVRVIEDLLSKRTKCTGSELSRNAAGA